MSFEKSGFRIKCRKLSELNRQKLLCLFNQPRKRFFNVHIFDYIHPCTDFRRCSIISNKANTAIGKKLCYCGCKQQDCCVGQSFFAMNLADKSSCFQNLIRRKVIRTNAMLIVRNQHVIQIFDFSICIALVLIMASVFAVFKISQIHTLQFSCLITDPQKSRIIGCSDDLVNTWPYMKKQQSVCFTIHIDNVEEFLLIIGHRLAAVLRCINEAINSIFAHSIDPFQQFAFVADSDNDRSTFSICKGRDQVGDVRRFHHC